MQPRRTLLLASAAIAALSYVVAAHAAPPGQRDDVVAVVFDVSQPYRGTITVSYPTPVSREQVTQDLGAIEGGSGWRLSPPGINSKASETEATAVMRPAAQPGPYGDPVWPVVSALRRFNRVTVVIFGPAYRGTEQSLDNRFVHCVVSAGQNLWSYDVTIKDRSFASVMDLHAQPPPSKPPVSAPQAPARPRFRATWWILAAALGLGAYLLAAWLLRERDPDRREQARRAAILRARRARNIR